MASLLNRILTLLGRAASDALSQKPSAPSGTSGSTTSGSAEPARARDPKPSSTTKPAPTHPHSHDNGSSTRAAAPSSQGVSVYDVSTLGLPAFSYSPDPDGDADPGEVVWTWVPYEEDPTQGKDRPVLVLARQADPGGRLVVAQMTSRDHDRDAAQEARWGRYWHDVGTGDWDSRGRPSEVRLDRLLVVEPSAVRREGATMRRDVFDGVVAALRAHWARSAHGDAGGCRPGAGRVVRKRDAPHAADGERARSC